MGFPKKGAPQKKIKIFNNNLNKKSLEPLLQNSVGQPKSRERIEKNLMSKNV